MIAAPIANHALELQVDLAFLGGPAGLAANLDFIVKRPFRLGEAWRPYVGIGPSISLEHLNAEPRDSSTSSFGVSGVGGAYYWFTGECAAMAYAQYTAVFAKPFRNALLLGFGFSYAFTADL